MREINIGENTVKIKGSPMTLLFYKQEFGTGLMSDIAKFYGLFQDKENKAKLVEFDYVICLQVVWAMAKTAAFGKEFPDFITWLSGIETIDLTNPSFFAAALEEAAQGLFPRPGQLQ